MTLLGSALNAVRERADRVRLRLLPAAACEAANLRHLPPDWLSDTLRSEQLASEWQGVGKEIEGIGITEDTVGGVNPGDRRALYYLVRALRPAHLLEVGTHIGASTVHIASALRANGRDGAMTTVDILDVNDPVARPWLRVGARHSPAELVGQLGMTDRVHFVARPSLEFLAAGPPRFDVIFLDGDHAPHTVYREVPAALRALNPGGVIILHDYFPGGRPLWTSPDIIVGPWLAMQRLRSEGCPLDVLPLGALPWPTKLGSNITSLALLSRSRPV